MPTTRELDPDPRSLLSDEDMLQFGLDRFRAARHNVDRMRDRWDRWYKLYRSFVSRPNWPFSTNLFIPLIFSVVEAFLPRLVAQRPRIVVEARNDEDIQVANNHRELLEYQWDFLGMPVKLMEFVKSALIYGTAWAKVGWETRTRDRKFKAFEQDQFGGVTEIEGTKPTVVYDDPVIDILPIEDVYPDPTGFDLDTCRYICHRMKMMWHELDEAVETRGYDREAVNKLKEIRMAKANEELDRHKNMKRDFTQGSTKPELEGAHLFEFDVIEYWEDDRLAVFTLEPEVILFNDVNPWWHGRKPFIRLVDNVLPNELFGVGEPEVLESINIELNEMHNMRMENVKRAVMQMFKVRVGSPITPDALKFKPQGVIPVRNQDDIEPLFSPISNIGASYREEDVLRLWSQLATGATDAFTGIESNLQSETATGASILSQAAASRVGLKFQILTEMALKPLAKMLIALNEQFMEDSRRITIIGPEGEQHRKLSPEDLATGGADFDVRIDIGATDPVNRELKTQRTIQGIQALASLPPELVPPQALQILIQRFLSLLDIDISPEQLQPAGPQITGATPAAEGGENPLANQLGNLLGSSPGTESA